MAREVIEQLVDDLDGSPAAETVSFGLDGLAFEIDLNEQHAADLRARLDPYRRTTSRVGRGTTSCVGVRHQDDDTVVAVGPVTRSLSR
jgi:hypothetical protein